MDRAERPPEMDPERPPARPDREREDPNRRNNNNNRRRVSLGARTSFASANDCGNKKQGNNIADKCVSCMDDIKDDPLKLTCQSSHSLCGECSAVFCESVMTEGYAAVVPNPKCSQCRAPIPALPFERCLKPEQLSTYLTYVTMQTLDDGECLLSCVNCNYSEIHADEPPIFYCRNPGCGSVHCLGCKVKFPPLSEEDDDFLQGQEQREKHLMCHALREEKLEFDKAIAAGNGMPCPGCRVVGRKDGMCTHMSCSGCGTEWCYLCGVSVEKCDKAPRTGEAATELIYGHNEDWEVNPLRCPMYITMLGHVDEDWKLEEEAMDSDDEYDQDEVEELCLNKFHHWKALQHLKALRAKLGAEKWSNLRNTFATVRNCGFSVEEIEDAADSPLFTRPETRPRVRPRIDVDLTTESP